jgi:intracellular multiplication protein IcmJ
MPDYQPILLGARRKSGTVFSEQKIVPKAVWQQDDFICQFCGFRAEKFQRVVPGAWCGQPRAALTACLYCEYCLTLDAPGHAVGGLLLWLPEITQAQLHHLCRALYLAKQQPELAERAQTALETLTSRRAEAKKRLGTDDPAMLGAVLLENVSDAIYQARADKLAGIRVMPHDRYLITTKDGVVDQFPAVLAYWQSPQGPFARLPVAAWLDKFPLSAA